MNHLHVKFATLSSSQYGEYFGPEHWQEWMTGDPFYAVRMAKSIERRDDTVIVALRTGDVHMFAWAAVTHSVVSKESL